MSSKKDKKDDEILTTNIISRGEIIIQTIKTVGATFSVFIIFYFIADIFKNVSYNLSGKNTQADIKMSLASSFLKVILENNTIGLVVSVGLNIFLLIFIFVIKKYYKKRISELAQLNSSYKSIIDSNRQSTGLNKFGK